MKREDRKSEMSVVVRDTTAGGREKHLTSVLKVPRHCSFVLNSAFALGPRKTSVELAGLKTFRMQTDF
jgi:hypothetical protein